MLQDIQGSTTPAYQQESAIVVKADQATIRPSILPRERKEFSLSDYQLPAREMFLTRPDLFPRFSQERFLPGTADQGILCVSGFGASAYSMQELGHVVNKRCHSPIIISPLASHNSFEEFKHTQFNAWVEQIIRQAERLKDPIGIFFSASSLAAIEAQRREPDLFKGFVFIGTPLKLNSTWSRLKISVVDFAEQMIGFLSPSLARTIDQIEVTTYEPSYDKRDRRYSVYTRSSVHSVLELYHGSLRAYKALPSIHVPILYLQGENDPLISKDVPKIIASRCNPELLTLKVYPGENHGPHTGENRNVVFNDIIRWKRTFFPELAT